MRITQNGECLYVVCPEADACRASLCAPEERGPSFSCELVTSLCDASDDSSTHDSRKLLMSCHHNPFHYTLPFFSNSFFA